MNTERLNDPLKAPVMDPQASRRPQQGDQKGRSADTAIGLQGHITGDGSLVERAMQSVTDHIHTNGLRAGDTLPSEKYFAECLGVSRTVMREAFRSLTALRVIDVGNGRRARVCAMDSRVMATSLNHAVTTAQISIAEIWEVRRTIETKTAARAAILRTDAEAQEILRLCDKIGESTDDFDRLIPLDIAFHQAIARASKNAFFAQLVYSFEPLMRLVATAAWRTRSTKSQKQKVTRIHRAISRAILKQDAEAAARAMDSHFDNAVEFVLHRVSPLPLKW